MSGKVNVVDDLAKICVEVGIGQANKVVQSVLRNISLPLKFAYSEKIQIYIDLQYSFQGYGTFMVNQILKLHKDFTFAFFTDGSEVGVGIHIGAEWSGEFQVFGWYGS